MKWRWIIAKCVWDEKYEARSIPEIVIIDDAKIASRMPGLHGASCVELYTTIEYNMLPTMPVDVAPNACISQTL